MYIMPNIVCPYCKKYDLCSIVKSGNISQVYKCYTCENEFEGANPTWKTVKEVSGVVLGLVAGAVTILGGSGSSGGGNSQT
ncbi:MAG: hypothetical protein RIS64_3976 [Bacteroidota bacterium]|jgi:DNA-directed RNA polymerase subunit RPC12/RpoP